MSDDRKDPEIKQTKPSSAEAEIPRPGGAATTTPAPSVIPRPEGEIAPTDFMGYAEQAARKMREGTKSTGGIRLRECDEGTLGRMDSACYPGKKESGPRQEGR